ncbi:sigma-70 family RNA polymerase sigma factor [Bacillus timonensis]|nr:sigma-70 family RNA polymerase sigma factor [Bacillus timonensis]
MPQIEDQILYNQVLAKDKKALEILYDRYEKLVYSFSFKMMGDAQLAEEVVQEVFIKLWRGIGSYEESKGKFSSWLLTITRHTAIDLIRKRKKEATVELEDRDSLVADEKLVEEQVEWKEEGNRLRRAVATLKKEQQSMINLFYFKGFTQQRISEECDIPLGTVKGRIRLALRHLRSYLDDEGRANDDRKEV